MVKTRTLGEMLSEEMTTEEIFQAWDILQDYMRRFSTVVEKRLIDCIRRNNLPGIDVTEEMAEEQRNLWDICDVLENMGVM